MKNLKSLRLLTGTMILAGGLSLVACGGEPAADDSAVTEPTVEVAPVVEEPTAEVIVEPTVETVAGEATGEATAEDAAAEGTAVADPYAGTPAAVGTTTTP